MHHQSWLLGPALLVAALSSQPIWGQDSDDYGDYSSGSTASSGNYGGTSSSPSLATQGHGNRSSNSTYGGSTNTYGRSSNSYGQSPTSYRTSGGSSKTTTGTAAPQRRDHSPPVVDYGTSTNTYGQSRSDYGTFSDTYNRTTRSSARRSGRYPSEPPIDPRHDPNYTNQWAMRHQGAWIRPLPVIGRVIGQAGKPIADAVIRLNCGNASYPMGYTDRKGRFSFSLNSCFPALSMSDASLGSRYQPSPHPTSKLSARRMSRAADGSRFRRNLARSFLTCQLEGYVPGYLSGHFRLYDLRDWDRTDLGTLILNPVPSDGGRTVSIDTLMAPEAARKAYRKGLRNLRKWPPNHQAALNHLEKAVDLHPPYAPAWTTLGEARMATGDREGAKQAFRTAIESDRKLQAPYEALLQVATEEGDLAEIVALGDQYLNLVPGASRVRFYRAVAAFQLGRFEAAGTAIAKLKDLGEAGRWATSFYMMALVHASRSDFEAAAAEFEAFLARAPEHELAATAKRMLYEWSKLQVIEPRGFPDGSPQASLASP